MMKQDFWWIVRQNLFEKPPEFCQRPDASCLPSWHHVHKDNDHGLACSQRIFEFSSSMETEDYAIPWIAFLSPAQKDGPGFICCKYLRQEGLCQLFSRLCVRLCSSKEPICAYLQLSKISNGVTNIFFLIDRVSANC